MKVRLFGRIASLILVFAVSVAQLSSPEHANAATKFKNNTYVTKEKVLEKPADVLDDPACVFTGTGSLQGLYIYSEKTGTVNLPMDGCITRDVLIINETDKYIELEGGSSGCVTYSGFLSEYIDETLLIFHPSPYNFFLAPHSSHRAVMTIGFNGYDRLTSDASGNFVINQHFYVSLANEGSDSFQRINEYVDYSLTTKINYITRKSAEKMNGKTAVIKGRVVDESGSKPKEYVRVTAYNGITPTICADIDENGYYSFELTPYYNEYYGMYQPFRISLDLGPYRYNEMKYFSQAQLVRVEPGQTITLDLNLKSHTHKPLYEKTGSLDLGIQGYWTDWSDDGNTIATVPFHSALPNKEEINDNCWLNIYDKTGNYSIKIDMDNETPYVDVSNDGEYIVTQFGDKDNKFTTVKIYKRNGTKVYERNVLPIVGDVTGTAYESDQFFSRCSKLSPDNSSLIMSNNNGEIHYIDWKSDKILWSAELHNQIRTIDFSVDGKRIYISCGDGHLYCYDTDGKYIWSSYVGSWGVATAIGSKYIAISVKCNANSLRLLDAKTGKQLWCYDTLGRGYLALSKDESMLYYGNDTSTSCSVANGMVFDTKTGKFLFATEIGSGNGMFTADGKYLAVRTFTNIDLFDTTDGSLVWSDEMCDGQAGGTTTLYISEDGQYIAAGYNTKRGYGTVNFYKRTVAADSDTVAKPAAKPARGVISNIADVKGAKVKVTVKKVDDAKKYQIKYTVEGDETVYKVSSKSNVIKLKCEKGKKITVSVRVKNASGWGKWGSKKSFVTDEK